MKIVSERPNIVFITTDTQGRNMVSSYVGRPGVETPNLDRLASEGVLFENAFVACPLCTPSRSAWYSGLYPNRNGAICNETSVRRKHPLLAELVKEAGYTCAHYGKWHLDAAGYGGGGHPDGGFDSCYDVANFNDEVGRGGVNRFGGWNKGLHDENFCFAHRVADRAIRRMREHDYEQQPILLAIEFDEPHGPYICPPPFNGRFKQDEIYIPSTFRSDMSKKPGLQQEYSAYLEATRPTVDTYTGYYHRYYDCNSYVDYEIGRVLDVVRAHMPENTLVIYTSDHGDHLGAFGLNPKGPTMYDATTAVPLIITGVGVQNTGRSVNDLIISLDIWQTILSVAGAKRPEDPGYIGRSLQPALADNSLGPREAVFMEYNRFGLGGLGADGFYPIRCARTQEWKLSINLFDKDELYHLSDDPEEADNRIDDPACADIRNHLHDLILEHMDTTKDTFYNPAWGRRPWRSDYRHEFQGFTTTGFKDQWAFGRLDD